MRSAEDCETLVTIDLLNEKIRYYDQMEAHIAAEPYRRIWLLQQVDGIGVHTALSFMRSP